MRQPGGLTVDMWNWTNDIDFYRAWANVIVNGTSAAATTRPYAVLYASRRDGRRYAVPHDELIRELGPLLIHHQRMETVFSGAIGDYGYVLRSPELEPLLAAARTVQAVEAAAA